MYYFPLTADVEHKHLTNFLKFNFPDPGERPFIDDVHEHKNIEAFCISVHDSVFEHANKDRTTQSNIIASISFPLLQEKDYSAVSLYTTSPYFKIEHLIKFLPVLASRV